MTITVPSSHVALVGLDDTIQRAQPIRASAISNLAQNAHYAYAEAGRRTVLNVRDIDITGLTSYTVVIKTRFDFAAQRELTTLDVSYKITNADVLITIRNAADGADVQTLNVTGTTTSTGTIAAPGAGNSGVVIKVEVQRLIAGAASLDLLRIWEGSHTNSTLPG